MAKSGLVEQQAKLHLQFIRVLGSVFRQQLLTDFFGLDQVAGDELMLGLYEAFDLGVGLSVFLIEAGCCGATDDQRRPGLVDENRVNLVNNGKIVPALHLILGSAGHAVVAEVVETKLRVGPVGDIPVVLLASFCRVHVVNDTADAKPEKLIDGTHPLAVPLGEVVIDCHEVNTAPGQGVKVNRQRGDERLAFAGGHLGNVALVQRHAADELHIVRDHLPLEIMAAHMHIGTVKPAAGIFHHGESFRQDSRQLLFELFVIVDGRELFLPLLGLLAQNIRRGR